uniref:Uncharacterized protein n=1 Tax=Peronospora matthiolae TaxID=2874970 RepID=A0AAV1V375_9STRA
MGYCQGSTGTESANVALASASSAVGMRSSVAGVASAEVTWGKAHARS